MNEKSSKRREWVKTAAIIFLTVLLLLTFFSQTILNHSLPEVATKYVQSGTITSKIRGSGVVESGDPYVVEIPTNYVGRKVSSIAFKTGDKIQKGDVLMILADGDGEELKAAKEALKMAEADLKAKQSAYDSAILEEEITDEIISSAKSNVSANSYRKKISALQEELAAAKEKIAPIQLAIDQLDQAIKDIDTQIGFEGDKKSLADAKVSTATTVQQQAQQARDAAFSNAQAAQAVKDAAVADSAALETEIAAGNIPEENIETLRAEKAAAIAAAEEQLQAANTALENADNTLAKANEELEKAIKKQSEQDASPVVNNITEQKNQYIEKRYGCVKQLEEANAEVDRISTELAELLKIIPKVDNLHDQLEAISEAKKAVSEAKEKVQELEDENGGSEIKAEISGTITSINVTSGKTIETRDVMVLQPEGQGYFMSFSVTNDQAKTLSVGDKASLVNSWYFNDMDITLRSIKPDRSDPAKQKMLTFSVDGEVTAGQSLSVSVGQKSQNYDYIVPNSALRNDNNGDYILIVESKSSPLGNRYIATRVDIQILAKDDTQSAISGGISGWEYVITTASAPIKAGDQVRLADY